MKLSKRLARLAQLVPHGQKVVDVGCDHGLLPCFLVQNGISPSVIGVDVHQGPFETARRAVLAAGLEDHINIRLGDGLLPLQPGEADTAIIAGMGGGTMKDILVRSPLVVEQLQQIILQPMSGEGILRKWLSANGWSIIDEDLLEEDERMYQIIAARKGEGQELNEMEADYGPLLIKNRHELLGRLLQKDISAVQDILLQLAKSPSSQSKERQGEFVQKLAQMKELKEWLSVAKPL